MWTHKDWKRNTWTHKDWKKYLLVTYSDDDGKITGMLRGDRIDYWFVESPTSVSVTMASGNTTKVTGTVHFMEKYVKALADSLSGKFPGYPENDE